MSQENIVAETKKRGRKPSNPDKKAIVDKLKNIAKQDIGNYIRINQIGDLNGLRLFFSETIDKKNDKSNSMPDEVRDCIKAIYYKDGFATVDLHDPLEAIKLLIQLGELK